MDAGDDTTIWQLVESQLDFHRRRPTHSWIDTLNRLWRKNRFVMTMDGMLRLPAAPPVLTRNMLTVSTAKWPLGYIAASRAGRWSSESPPPTR